MHVNYIAIGITLFMAILLLDFAVLATLAHIKTPKKFYNELAKLFAGGFVVCIAILVWVITSIRKFYWEETGPTGMVIVFSYVLVALLFIRFLNKELK